MNIDDTHWHDCVIARVIEDTNEDTISFEVECPDGKEYKQCKMIIFKDILDYEIHEGPFAGCPSILDVGIVGNEANRKAIKIETNAGYRLIKCRAIESI